jgi:hypothetical protein
MQKLAGTPSTYAE